MLIAAKFRCVLNLFVVINKVFDIRRSRAEIEDDSADPYDDTGEVHPSTTNDTLPFHERKVDEALEGLEALCDAMYCNIDEIKHAIWKTHPV